MIPLKHEIPNMPRFRYNEDLCSARACVERLFSVWKAVFRCLSVQRKLMYEPGMAGKIVNACVVLHNMRIAYGMAQDVEFDEIDHEQYHRANIVAEPNEVEYGAFQGWALAARIQEEFY